MWLQHLLRTVPRLVGISSIRRRVRRQCIRLRFPGQAGLCRDYTTATIDNWRIDPRGQWFVASFPRQPRRSYSVSPAIGPHASAVGSSGSCEMVICIPPSNLFGMSGYGPTLMPLRYYRPFAISKRNPLRGVPVKFSREPVICVSERCHAGEIQSPRLGRRAIASNFGERQNPGKLEFG